MEQPGTPVPSEDPEASDLGRVSSSGQPCSVPVRDDLMTCPCLGRKEQRSVRTTGRGEPDKEREEEENGSLARGGATQTLFLL